MIHPALWLAAMRLCMFVAKAVTDVAERASIPISPLMTANRFAIL